MWVADKRRLLLLPTNQLRHQTGQDFYRHLRKTQVNSNSPATAFQNLAREKTDRTFPSVCLTIYSYDTATDKFQTFSFNDPDDSSVTVYT